MTNSNDELVLDAEGIPILTNLVRENETSEPSIQSQQDDVSVDELAELLLNSDAFKQQLEIIATELTRTVHQQMELTLRPILEEAISLALDDSSTASHEAVRKQLEAALPDLIARSLKN